MLASVGSKVAMYGGSMLRHGLTMMGRIVMLLVILSVMFTSVVLPAQQAKAAPTYPVLPIGLNYYQTTFPAGLRYSPTWYGTFEQAPRAQAILLYDDDYNADWGMTIFAMSPAPKKQPEGPQGGTTLIALTRDEAVTIIESYNLDATYKSFDEEIYQVMEPDHYFSGAWGGDKIQDKWNYGLYGEEPTYIEVVVNNLDGTITKKQEWSHNRFERPPPEFQSQRQKDYIKDNAGKVSKQVDLLKYDPPRYWVGNGGNWSDNVTHWSASTGGAPGASLPTSADSVYFDANSFTIAGQTVTVDAVANSLDMDWTGATNTPTLAGSFDLNTYGNTTFIVGMNITFSGVLAFRGTTSLTTNGQVLSTITYIYFDGPALTLLDALNIGTRPFYINSGTLSSGGNTITCGQFAPQGTVTLTLGNSTINCTSLFTGTPTYTANTATINISGTGALAGNGVNYNGTTFNLNGTAHTISGNNTFATLGTNSTATQTITFTDGTNQTATTFNLSGTSGKQHTLQGSGVGGWGLIKTAGTVTADYITISRSTASGGATFNAVGSSLNGGNNVGWNFPLTISTQAATGTTMDKDGVTGGLLNGTITDMGGATGTTYFEYGLTVAYGSTTAPVAYTTVGAFTGAMPVGLTPGATYHARAVMDNGSTTANGADTDFTFTLPAVTTQASTGITMDKDGLTGGNYNTNITNMGVASDTYSNIEYGLTIAYGTTTPNVTKAVIGSFATAIPTALTPGATYHFRSNTIVGAITVNGADESFTFTMPTTSTGSATIAGSTVILPGNLGTIGVASDVYGRFEYGTTPSMGSFTALQTLLGVGNFSDTIASPSSDTTLYYRSMVTVGSVSTYGATSTVSVPSATGGFMIKLLLRIVLASSILISIVIIGSKGGGVAMLVASVIGLAAFAIIDTFINTLF